MKRRFVTLDVFTRKPLSGNPLAVVLDAEGLDTRLCRASRVNLISPKPFLYSLLKTRSIARWCGSLRPPRSFLSRDIPLWGRLFFWDCTINMDAKAHAVSDWKSKRVSFLVWPRFAKRGRGKHAFLPLACRFMKGQGPAILDVARALSLEPHDIGFGNHVPSRHGVSGVFDFIPIATREAMSRIVPQIDLFDRVFGERAHQAIYVYTNEPCDAGHHFHARMFAPVWEYLKILPQDRLRWRSQGC
jgi:trans-2,3-dihydro-3-hydroxyanthranilate isomerase